MTDKDDRARTSLRRSVYALLIFLGVGAMLGRILAVESVDQIALENYRRVRVRADLDNRVAQWRLEGMSTKGIQKRIDQLEQEERRWDAAKLRRPFLSGNDRSRWCTIRALVEPEMRVTRKNPLTDKMEVVPYAIDKVIQEPTWDTIDMVKHDGHVYSSKPPLFPTLMAAEYWLIYKTTGMSLATHPFTVGRFMLITINLIPLVIFFVLLARLIERFGTTDWGRLFVMAAAVFGTFLTTFVIVINNHLPAAASAMVALYAGIRIYFDDERRLRYFAIAGLFAAFTAANELPALSLFAAISLVLLLKNPGRTMLAYVPAALLVIAGFFATNMIAHDSWRPPYMHRGEASKSVEGRAGIPDHTPDESDWYDYNYERGGRTYASHWTHRTGIDRGEESRPEYVLHSLVGHHGIFSLTPIWLLSVVGLLLWLCCPSERNLRGFAAMIGVLSVVCIVFYLMRPQVDRNYGGMTSGFRWVFWFAPMWLLAMIPTADALSKYRATRVFALTLLAVSILSVSYPTWNPWVHPWIWDYLHRLGWIHSW